MAAIKRKRIENSLWGLFIADALAMPVHWYYNPDNIQTDFPGGISGFEAPKHPHPESFMVGMEYSPDTEMARELGRPFDILHHHARFYKTSYTDLTIERKEQEGQHGNAVPALEDRYHYHHSLDAGENTVGAHLVRVLLRSVGDNREYRPEEFIRAYIDFLTDVNGTNDPYREIYIRRWFESYSRGADPMHCADTQRRTWSIGSHGGMVRPMVVSLLAPENIYKSVGNALEHQNLTHRSENVASGLHIVIPLLNELLQGSLFTETVERFSGRMHLPKISGKELYVEYRKHNGPGNIPPQKMWRFHTEYEKLPWDIEQFTELHRGDPLAGNRLATACYPEHGLPLLLFHLYSNKGDFHRTLCDTANAGGDNVHRGMIAGLLAGAAADEIPENLKTGLKDHDTLEEEIKLFCNTVLNH